MVEIGKTYSGKTVIGLDGAWVKYDEGNGWQGECPKEIFMLRYVVDEPENIELKSVDLSESVTFKEILLSYGFNPETIVDWTEDQCKAECEDINRESQCS